MAYFQEAFGREFWRTTLIIEAAFRLYNFFIDTRESSIISLGSSNYFDTYVYGAFRPIM
jgi:hypothetical protein